MMQMKAAAHCRANRDIIRKYAYYTNWLINEEKMYNSKVSLPLFCGSGTEFSLHCNLFFKCPSKWCAIQSFFSGYILVHIVSIFWIHLKIWFKIYVLYSHRYYTQVSSVWLHLKIWIESSLWNVIRRTKIWKYIIKMSISFLIPTRIIFSSINSM